MKYLANNIDKRFAPAALVPGARSVISLAVSYAPPAGSESEDGAFVSCYARGRDYHKVLKKRCNALMDAIGKLAPEFEGRAFVDTAPLSERSAAKSPDPRACRGTGCRARDTLHRRGLPAGSGSAEKGGLSANAI